MIAERLEQNHILEPVAPDYRHGIRPLDPGVEDWSRFVLSNSYDAITRHEAQLSELYSDPPKLNEEEKIQRHTTEFAYAQDDLRKAIADIEEVSKALVMRTREQRQLIVLVLSKDSEQLMVDRYKPPKNGNETEELGHATLDIITNGDIITSASAAHIYLADFVRATATVYDVGEDVGHLHFDLACHAPKKHEGQINAGLQFSLGEFADIEKPLPKGTISLDHLANFKIGKIGYEKALEGISNGKLHLVGLKPKEVKRVKKFIKSLQER